MFTTGSTLQQIHISLEFVTSEILQWWSLMFQSDFLGSSKISELVQPGESLRFLFCPPGSQDLSEYSIFLALSVANEDILCYPEAILHVWHRMYLTFLYSCQKYIQTNFVPITVACHINLYHELYTEWCVCPAVHPFTV